MIFGWGALIREKDARIADLKKEIEDLKKLIIPSESGAPHRIPVVQLEADAIISGREEAYELTPEETKELDGVESEAQRVLSGNYDNY